MIVFIGLITELLFLYYSCKLLGFRQCIIRKYHTYTHYQEMDSCVTNLLNYPVEHMSKLKDLSRDQLLLRNTIFFPSYPFMVLTSILCNSMLAGWMISYFFTSEIHQCYEGVTLGIQILACVYPLYQIIIFVTLLVSGASEDAGSCCRWLLILLFAIITTSFGFAGLGVVYTCIAHYDDPAAIPSSFLTQNYFVQILVYFMLIFILLYILLVPCMTFLYTRRNPYEPKTNCDCFICIMYVFFQILLFLGMIVFLAILLGGVPVLFYLLNGLSSMKQIKLPQFFGFAITCLVAPFSIFLVVQLLTHFIGCGESDQMKVEESGKEMSLELSSDKKKSEENTPQTENQDSNREVLLEDVQSKNFGDQDFDRK